MRFPLDRLETICKSNVSSMLRRQRTTPWTFAESTRSAAAEGRRYTNVVIWD